MVFLSGKHQKVRQEWRQQGLGQETRKQQVLGEEWWKRRKLGQEWWRQEKVRQELRKHEKSGLVMASERAGAGGEASAGGGKARVVHGGAGVGEVRGDGAESKKGEGPSTSSRRSSPTRVTEVAEHAFGSRGPICRTAVGTPLLDLNPPGHGSGTEGASWRCRTLCWRRGPSTPAPTPPPIRGTPQAGLVSVGLAVFRGRAPSLTTRESRGKGVESNHR